MKNSIYIILLLIILLLTMYQSQKFLYIESFTTKPQLIKQKYRQASRYVNNYIYNLYDDVSYSINKFVRKL